MVNSFSFAIQICSDRGMETMRKKPFVSVFSRKRFYNLSLAWDVASKVSLILSDGFNVLCGLDFFLGTDAVF